MLPPDVYLALFNQSPIGEYLLSPAEDPVILAVNDTFLQAAGRTREQLVGQRLFAAFAGDPTDGGDSGVDALRWSLSRVLQTRQADALPLQRYPISVLQPDGSVVFEERFWHAVSTPIFDSAGSLVCIAHRTEDVTATHRLTLALHASKREIEAERARLQVIIDTIPTGLIMLDEKGAFVLENVYWRQTWAGSTALGEIVDYERYKGFWPETGTQLSAQEWPCALALEQGIETKDAVIDIERLDGTRGTIVVSSAPICDAQGQVIGAVAANMDITELRSIQRQLQETDHRKDEFLAMLAHELRNPLAPVATAAELLLRNASDPVGVSKKSAIISRQVRHMVSLIDDLMDVSRVTRGLVILERVELDANQVVLDAVEQVRPALEARGHDLTLHLASDKVRVHADATRLVQVLSNVLANAIKYTPTPGKITLSTAADAHRVRFVVSDDGQGMEAELVQRCFNMFSQAKRSSDRSAGGLGLGLALVKSLVELHGGSVVAESQGVGHGSRFTVTLPRLMTSSSDSQVPAASVEARERLSANPRAHAPVLIVDDNRDAAETMGMLVESLGYEPVVEFHPVRALERLSTLTPRVCLLDIGLPDMSGYELAQEIRKRLAPAPVTLIGITGYGQPQDREEALRAGFDAHFVKPVESDALAGFLSSLQDPPESAKPSSASEP